MVLQLLILVIILQHYDPYLRRLVHNGDARIIRADDVWGKNPRKQHNPLEGRGEDGDGNAEDFRRGRQPDLDQSKKTQRWR